MTVGQPFQMPPQGPQRPLHPRIREGAAPVLGRGGDGRCEGVVVGEEGRYMGGGFVDQFEAVVADARADEVGEVGGAALGLWDEKDEGWKGGRVEG